MQELGVEQIVCHCLVRTSQIIIRCCADLAGSLRWRVNSSFQGLTESQYSILVELRSYWSSSSRHPRQANTPCRDHLQACWTERRHWSSGTNQACCSRYPGLHGTANREVGIVGHTCPMPPAVERPALGRTSLLTGWPCPVARIREWQWQWQWH